MATTSATGKKIPQVGEWAYTSKSYDWPLAMRYVHEACVAAHNAVGALDLAERTAKDNIFGQTFAEYREVKAANVAAYDAWQQLEHVLAAMAVSWERGLLK